MESDFLLQHPQHALTSSITEPLPGTMVESMGDLVMLGPEVRDWHRPWGSVATGEPRMAPPEALRVLVTGKSWVQLNQDLPQEKLDFEIFWF